MIKLPIEQMSEAMASPEVRVGGVPGRIGAGACGAGTPRPAAVAWGGAPPEDAAAMTGAGVENAGAINGFWQPGQTIWVPA